MAIVHPEATLRPSKLALLSAWLPTSPWYRGPVAPELEQIAGFRFDDPDGEVGIETLLVRAGDGPVYQIPMTYRGAPLPGRDEWLIGTGHHSTLGPRFVYDACGDPLYARVLATTILTGAGQAEVFAEIDGELVHRSPTMAVRGSGAPAAAASDVTTVIRVEHADPTLIVTDSGELAVRRLINDGVDSDGRPVLTGTWLDRVDVPLADIRR